MNNHNKIPVALEPHIHPDSLIARSPGRINLIGEHTDYNEGFVLPGAIDKAVYVSVKKNDRDHISLYSIDFNESIEVRLPEIQPIPGHWATYVFGVVAQFKKKGLNIPGFDMSIYGDVPVGAGLSSSAAIECSVAFALNELFELKIPRMELALLSQAAEHEYAGVKCGIMDQFASLFGKEEHVMKLDCRSLEYEYIPFKPEGYRLVLFDTKVKHSLASTEYNVRRSQCEEGVMLIRQQYPAVKSLRDATTEIINECIGEFETVRQRCLYVVEENSRLQKGCQDLVDGDLASFGKKMFATHEGLRRQYEVSCPELDILVDTVKPLQEVIGARMMGGGFGGCTINIIKETDVEELTEKVSRVYKAATGTDLASYTVRISDGTSIMNQ